MKPVSVALVATDPAVRDRLARTFDGAPANWSVSLHDEPPADADVVVGGSPHGVDVLFDPAAPERALEETRERVERKSANRVYIVTGATAQCGVTSVALHLAQCIARRAETCVVDLDPRWSGVAERLDLHEEETRTWADAGDDERSLRLAAIPVPGGFRVLLAPGDAEDRERREIVRRAAHHMERVVVDVPPGRARDELLTSAAPGTPAVLVAPATLAGSRRAGVILETHPALRWALVFNRTGPGGQESAARLARRAGRTSALELPCTPALRDAEEEGRLLTPGWTRWSRRMARLATALERA